MPTRIYALAKELKIENKTLVDICTQIGITGKGSALASLTDEEEVKVKAHIEKLKSTRPSAVLPPGSGPLAARIAAAGSAAPVRREDYVGPAGGATKRMPVLGGKDKIAPVAKKPADAEVLTPAGDDGQQAEAPEKPEKAEKPDRASPTPKLAPMPAAQLPSGPMKPTEPPPQKPEMRLPKEALRPSRPGSKPLSKLLEEQNLKRLEAAKKEAKQKKEPATAGRQADAAGGRTDRDGAAKRKHRGRGEVPGPVGEEGDSTLGGREQRQLQRNKRRGAPADAVGLRTDDESDRPSLRSRPRFRRQQTTVAPVRKTHAEVDLPCTVRSLSEAMGIPATQVIAKLLALGVPTTITAEVDRDQAALVGDEVGIQLTFREPVSLEQKMLTAFEEPDDPATLEPRPPIVTFLGHVDHGKTSLLDKIIGLNVASREKGGITQHIRAYRVDKDGRSVTFLDTPGHEAFTAMRARGANATDIAVLVVAADDGVMPQTEEAISHAKAAGVPIVVALNKIDLPTANPDRAMQELATNQLLPAEWGGDTEVVRTSATTGQGLDTLIETLLTVAELHEYKANPGRAATGICLEAEKQPGRGVVAKLLVQKGSLSVGDVVVCGESHGRIKAMYDTLSVQKKHKTAGPSMPVNVTGFDVAPGAGDRFYVMHDVSVARQIAESAAARNRVLASSGPKPHVPIEELVRAKAISELNIVLRADVRGSIEAIVKELEKLQHPEVHLKILQKTVGGITEADVHLADVTGGLVIGFNVVPDERARALADQRGVEIRRFDIIYQVADDLKRTMEGMIAPEKREKELGRAMVLQAFRITRVGTVAGCRVLAGTIQRDGRARIIRDQHVVGTYAIESLKREKDDAREVREGYECGIKLAGFDDVKEGDVLEVYKIEEVRRTF